MAKVYEEDSHSSGIILYGTIISIRHLVHVDKLETTKSKKVYYMKNKNFVRNFYSFLY